MTVGTTVIAATLDDSATARDFFWSLPVTMKMTRWGNREYYGKVANRLSEEAAQKRNRFANRDVACWAPGGSSAVFYNDTDDTSISDLKAFNTLDESVDMGIEVAR